MSTVIQQCALCRKFWDVRRHSEKCPHRYGALQVRLEAGEKIPAATRDHEDNQHWQLLMENARASRL